MRNLLRLILPVFFCLSSGLVFADNYKYVAFVACKGGMAPTNLCFVTPGNANDISYLDVQGSSNPGIFDFKTILQAGQNTRDGIGILLNDHFRISATNKNPQASLSIKIYKRDTKELVFEKVAERNQKIEISN